MNPQYRPGGITMRMQPGYSHEQMDAVRQAAQQSDPGKGPRSTQNRWVLPHGRVVFIVMLSIMALSQLALTVTFGVDGAWLAFIIPAFGLISCAMGAVGLWQRSANWLTIFTVSAFLWICGAVVHICMMQKLIEVPQDNRPLVLGRTLATNEPADRLRALNIAYPTLYAIAIWFTCVTMVMSCLLPASRNAGGKVLPMDEDDPYYHNEWYDDLNAPHPAHYPDPYDLYSGQPVIMQPTPSMVVSIPTPPMYGFPPHMSYPGQHRSMPSLYPDQSPMQRPRGMSAGQADPKAERRKSREFNHGTTTSLAGADYPPGYRRRRSVAAFDAHSAHGDMGDGYAASVGGGEARSRRGSVYGEDYEFY